MQKCIISTVATVQVPSTFWNTHCCWQLSHTAAGTRASSSSTHRPSFSILSCLLLSHAFGSHCLALQLSEINCGARFLCPFISWWALCPSFGCCEQRGAKLAYWHPLLWLCIWNACSVRSVFSFPDNFYAVFQDGCSNFYSLNSVPD